MSIPHQFFVYMHNLGIAFLCRVNKTQMKKDRERIGSLSFVYFASFNVMVISKYSFFFELTFIFPLCALIISAAV